MNQARNHPILIEMTTVPETGWAFFRGRLRFFKDAGFKVYYISSPGELMEKISQREGIDTIPLCISRGISVKDDMISIFHLFRIFIRLKPDIVHAHMTKAGLLGMIAATLARVPLRFYTIHGLHLEFKGVRKWIMQSCETISSRLAHQVFCVSPSVAQIAVAKNISRSDRIKVLANGSINGIDAGYFDPEKFGKETRESLRSQYAIPDSALLIGYIGRIVRDKGMIELAESWKTLREEFPETHLLICGPFEDHDPVPDHVEKLFHSDPRIHLTGYVDEVAPLYSAMDIVVLPTYREGFPYAPIEAQAMSLPVITSNVPGAKDSVIDGVTGILIPAKNSGMLTEEVTRLIKNTDMRKKMGRTGRERVLRDFQPEEIWRHLEREYKEWGSKRGIH